MLTTTEIILEYVCPSLGCLFLFVMVMGACVAIPCHHQYVIDFISNSHILFLLNNFSTSEGCSRGCRQWYAGSTESDAMGLPDWRLPWVVNHHANHFAAFLIVFVLTEKILILWDRVIYSYLIQVR
jgi:hypothetical protein